MNTIAKFRKCTLSDKELLDAVDKETDKMFTNRQLPIRNIPAKPDEDYDLLVGELILRFMDKLQEGSSMNTLEEKQAFFDLYSGQQVICHPDLDRTINNHGCRDIHIIDHDLFIEKAYALLTPIEQITDEHAVELGYPDAEDIIGSYDLYDDLPHSLADGLRQLGYALQFRGKSVEELVKLGWAKLKI